MSFATVTDYEDRLPLVNGERIPLTQDEKHKVETLIDDAGALIRSEFSRRGKSVRECIKRDKHLVQNLRAVTVNMVMRKMTNEDEMDYTQHTMTAGSFTESYTLSNPSGDLYLTAQERKALGIFGSARIGSTSNYEILDCVEDYPQKRGA